MSRPTIELNLFLRALLWAFRSEASSVLAIGILFTIGTGLRYLMPSDARTFQTVVMTVIVLLIFGVFIGVIELTEENKEYRSSGARVRVSCGAVALAAIAFMLSAPLEGIALAALLGAFLGYVGIYWAKYL
jgi:hypothetical protein